jgi:hypothetical protein
MKPGIPPAFVSIAIATMLTGLAHSQPATPATAGNQIAPKVGPDKGPNAAVPRRTIVNLLEPAGTNGPLAAGDEVLPVVDFDDVAVADGIQTLASHAGLRIRFDPRLTNLQDIPHLTFKWRNVTARQALKALLDNSGWQITQFPGNAIFRIEARNRSAPGPLETKVNLLDRPPTKKEIPDNFALDKVPLLNGVQTLAAQAKLNIIIDPAAYNQKAADGTLVRSTIVSETWEQVPARQALQVLLDQFGWQAARTPGLPILRIVVKNP